MHIIELTENLFNQYSKENNFNNYKQTSNYANFMTQYNYKKIYLGLVDDNNNINAAVLILQKHNIKYRYGYAPSGYIIDYTNTSLLETFTKELKKYLNKLNYIYLRIDPKYPVKIKNTINNKIDYKTNYLISLSNLGYQEIKNSQVKEEYFLNINSNIDNYYKNFDRSIKRKIKEANLMGITVYKNNNIQNFYNIIKKKKTNNIDYYDKLIKTFNNNVNIYFAKINTETYLNNFRFLLKQEKEKNEYLKNRITNFNIKNKDKILNKKIKSDKTIIKYSNKVKEASTLFTKYPNGLDISTCLVIEMGNTLFLIEEGYNDELRNIYSLSMLRWEIIKKYSANNFNNFFLGEINNNKNFDSKIGFNPVIIEYPKEFDLIINKYFYKLINFNFKYIK